MRRERAGERFWSSTAAWSGDPTARRSWFRLQQVLPTLERNGIALFAISYDSVTILAAFAAKHGIGYPLLSDREVTRCVVWASSTSGSSLYT